MASSSVSACCTSLKLFILSKEAVFKGFRRGSFAISSGSSSTTGSFLSLSFERSRPFKKREIEMAASLPALTAATTVAGPVTMSPPAKTPGTAVAKVTESTVRFPHLLMLKSSFLGRKERSTSCPIAGITESTLRVICDPSMGTGRRLPLSSGSPSSMRMHSIPLTFPSMPVIRWGAIR